MQYGRSAGQEYGGNFFEVRSLKTMVTVRTAEKGKQLVIPTPMIYNS